tara:strand:- start:37 stop:447 length:411 start_codon:yes stop_codon:yes gene_type:complete
MDYWERAAFETRNRNLKNNMRFYTPLHDVRQFDPINDLPCDLSYQPIPPKQYPLTDPPSDQYLTQREAECAYYLCQGLTMKRIAHCLALSPRTVEFYIKRMREKLNVVNKSHLIQRLNNSTFAQHFDATCLTQRPD